MTPGTVVEVRAHDWGHVAIFRSPEGVVTDCRLANPLEVALYETVAELREELSQAKTLATEQEAEIERLTKLVTQLNRVIDPQNSSSPLSPNHF